MTTLLLASIGIHLFLAIQTFQKDKTALIFDLTKNSVTTLSTEMETSLTGILDKLKLFALTSSENHSKIDPGLYKILENDPFIVHVELSEIHQSQNPPQSQSQKLINKLIFSQKKVLEIFNIDDHFFTETLPSLRPIPYDDIKKKVVSIWNATIDHGPPLIGVGIALALQNQNLPNSLKPNELAVVAYFKADLFLKDIASAKATDTFVIDSSGKILIHSDAQMMTSAARYFNSPNCE